MQEIKPNLSFSVDDGFGNRSYGVQENGGGRLLFPFGDIKHLSAGVEVEHIKERGNNSTGYWTGWWRVFMARKLWEEILRGHINLHCFLYLHCFDLSFLTWIIMIYLLEVVQITNNRVTLFCIHYYYYYISIRTIAMWGFYSSSWLLLMFREIDRRRGEYRVCFCSSHAMACIHEFFCQE